MSAVVGLDLHPDAVHLHRRLEDGGEGVCGYGGGEAEDRYVPLGPRGRVQEGRPPGDVPLLHLSGPRDDGQGRSREVDLDDVGGVEPHGEDGTPRWRGR